MRSRESLALVRTLSGHERQVLAVAVPRTYATPFQAPMTAPEGVRGKTGREARTLSGHENRVTAVAVTLDGRYAVSGSWTAP